jgi:hypothetical protein
MMHDQEKDQDLENLNNLLKAADDDEDQDKDQEEDEEKDLKKNLKKGEDEKKGDDDKSQDTKEPDAKSIVEDKSLKKVDDDKDAKDYDAAYMRKYLKKCMTENPEAAKKYAKELGYLKKASDDAAGEMDMEETEGVLIEDGTNFVKAQIAFNDGILKAIDALTDGLEKVSQGIAVNNELAKASAKVLAKAHADKSADEVIVDPKKSVSATMQKANDQSELKGLKKAADMDFHAKRRMILKAVDDGDIGAMNVAVYLDTCKGNMNLLSPEVLKDIDRIAEKYAQDQPAQKA